MPALVVVSALRAVFPPAGGWVGHVVWRTRACAAPQEAPTGLTSATGSRVQPLASPSRAS